MRLTIINSNSKGNAYVLTSASGQALLIECGVNFDQIKIAVKFNLKSVIGCILTHEHGDHAKSVYDVLKYGIHVYTSPGTHNALETTEHHRAGMIRNGESVQLGEYRVKAFDTKHDCAEPLGYIIHHRECGNVLFLTDSYYCEYKFLGINNVIIEANYCQTILDARVAGGSNPQFLRDRVIRSHMSLATCKEMLRSMDLSQVNNIVLIHLSDGNSDAARFKREVQEVTAKTVHVADANMILPFDKKPF